MAADTPGQDPAGEDARIASLEERIARAEHAEKVRQGAKEQQADDGSRPMGIVYVYFYFYCRIG